MPSKRFATSSGGATLTLPEYASQVTSVVGLIGAATSVASTSATIVTAAPTGTEAQFTGTAEAPDDKVILGATWVTASDVTVEWQSAARTVSDL